MPKVNSCPEKRLYASERETMIQLQVATQIIEEAKQHLTTRIAMIDDMDKRFDKMRDDIEQINMDLIDTIPVDSLKTLMHNMKSAGYVTGVRKPGRRDDDFGIWLSFADLNTILYHLQDHCMMCYGDLQAERSCPLRKVFDTIGVDHEHGADGSCGYKESLAIHGKDVK